MPKAQSNRRLLQWRMRQHLWAPAAALFAFAALAALGNVRAEEKASAASKAPAQSASDSGTLAKSRETFRKVEIRGEWFYVNGEPFLVKGVGYSPYRPGQAPWTSKVDLQQMERDFRMISEAGFNTIRTWAPLSPEALSLADKYGLMVLQGIWVERRVEYAAPAFQETMLAAIGKQVDSAKGHDNILAFLVGNELLPEAVFQTGVGEIEALFKRAANVVKLHDPARFVSYANWPSLAFLNADAWDLIGFNLYPYEPANVTHSFGFRGYVERLKQSMARRRPLIITELGISVSPTASSKPGYGGMSVEAQREGLVNLWDDLFQAGAQGGVIFEWNDEWWKQGDKPGDAETHDPADPEEWFGLTEFTSPADPNVKPRPAYDALKTYNQAILVSPVSGESYQDRLPVTLYTTDNVTQLRVRIGNDKWYPATKINRHWWKVQVPLSGQKKAPQTEMIVFEAFDQERRLLVRRQRPLTLAPASEPVHVIIATDKTAYTVGQGAEPMRITMTVVDASGAPLANRPVSWSVFEPQNKVELLQSSNTDAQGRIGQTYLVREPGIVGIAAATPRDRLDSQRRVGAELFVLVRQQQLRVHEPSVWERNLPEAVREGLRHEKPVFQLADIGKEQLVDYAHYGTFHDVGKSTYHYEIKDWEGLSAAVGEGVYPNDVALLKDPAYQAAKKAGKLTGSHWDFVFFRDPQLEFFRWAEAEEEPGVKQYYTAMALEHAGQWMQAVKAYYAILVHFPTSIGWTGFDPPTPWYVGKVARDKIEAILRLHPEMGWRLENAQVLVEHGFDNDPSNDVIRVNPGALSVMPPETVNPPAIDCASLQKKRVLGKGSVRLVQFENGHWQLLVDGVPWEIHGITYQPSAVGESPDEGTLKDWMTADRNGNGRIDAFDTFVDANRNNRQDANEPTVGDFALLKEMGVNTIRLYHHATNKTLLRQVYQQYGIRFIMGDFVGMYTVGSGAKWEEGTNYLDPVQRRRMTESVKSMIRDFKDEPYILMWVLGNENNYGGVHGIVGGKGNAGQHPTEYYRFINDLASWIHSADANHPVAIANGDEGFLDLMAPLIPSIDIFGANVYRGWYGFGRSFFEEVRRYLDKPVLITEYGSPAYQANQPQEVADRDQALYHLGNWVDVKDNTVGRGVGNALGGIVFEWSDEWWKAGQPPKFSPKSHETQPNWAGPFPGGWNFEEWYGLVSQGDGSQSPYLRQPRLSYDMYKVLWGKASAERGKPQAR